MNRGAAGSYAAPAAHHFLPAVLAVVVVAVSADVAVVVLVDDEVVGWGAVAVVAVGSRVVGSHQQQTIQAAYRKGWPSVGRDTQRT